MGDFSLYLNVYLAIAFSFQTIALLFAGVDGSCRSNRFAWLALIFFTGPVGLLIYFIWGRERRKRA
ncbi:MAG: PLDc N-terminal domain-containing protein [Candidatus Riflebacteria bacterium]